MKVSSEHLEALKTIIAPLDTEETRAGYRNGQYARADVTRDVNTRYRWDLFHASRGWQIEGMDQYDDSHLDTALRHLVPPL